MRIDLSYEQLFTIIILKESHHEARVMGDILNTQSEVHRVVQTLQLNRYLSQEGHAVWLLTRRSSFHSFGDYTTELHL